MKIGVIGSMNIDKVATVDHIPHKGETLLATAYMETFGGKGANQAVALARLGADITMFGCVGDDSDGIAVIKHMEAEGIQVEAIKVINETPTGCAFINVGGGDNAIVVVQGANHHVTLDYIKSIESILDGMDMLLLQNEIPTETIEYVLDRYGHKPYKTVIYNPAPYKKIKDESLLKADYMTPNEHEARALNEDVLGLPLGGLIITKGAKGADYYENGKFINITATACKPLDTTGAGDTFNGALAYAISINMPLGEAVRFANTAAGMATEKQGAQVGMPSLEAVKNRMQALG